MSNRYFENWVTWEARTLKDGLKEFIIVFVPMDDFLTQHSLGGTAGMIKGFSKGVCVVKELTALDMVRWDRV